MSKQIFVDKTASRVVTSGTDLLSFINEIDFVPIYRGQSNLHWGLVPTIARQSRDLSGLFERSEPFTKETENNFIHRFKRHSYSFFDRPLNDWETLFLARHHNLPVRLLDWTTSPLVALYHACVSKDSRKKDGAIWVFRNAPETIHKYENVFKNNDPRAISGIRVIFPFYSDPRMIAQSSVFTIHDHPWPDVSELTSDYSEDNDVVDGQKWKVCKDCKKSIIEELCKLQINTGTLFPDFDGIAQAIVNSELVFRQKR